PPPHLHSFPTRRSSDLSQVVKLRAPHRRALGHLDLVDARRVEGKGPLHAHAVGDAPHRERGPGPAPALADHHALEGLQALFLTLDRKSTRLNSSHVSIS